MSHLDISFGGFFAGLRPASLRIRTRLAVWRSRRALAQLDDRALQDIGVTREEATREASVQTWDVPSTWTRV